MLNIRGHTLSITCFLFMTTALYAIFLYAPTEKTMGDVQTIFYFHISSWWIAGLALAISCITSALYLWKRDKYFDALTVASIELGILFMTIGLITGPIWAKPVWGVYWTWDPRLTSALICWLMYIGIFMLRRYITDGSKQANLASVSSIIAFINVPFVFMTIRLFRTQHPQPVIGGGEDSGLTSTMTHTLLISLIAFILLYLWMLQKRLAIDATEQQVEQLHKEYELV